MFLNLFGETYNRPPLLCIIFFSISHAIISFTYLCDIILMRKEIICMFYQCSTVVHASSKTYPSPLSVEIPTQCPICSVAYNDIPLSIHQFERETFHTGHVFASAVYFCPHCENSFYVTYVLSSSDYPVVAHIYATYPTNEHKGTIDHHLKETFQE